jgi:hypothetical protein
MKYIGIHFVGMMSFKTVAPGIVRFAALVGIGGNGTVNFATNVLMACHFLAKTVGAGSDNYRKKVRMELISRIMFIVFAFLLTGCAARPDTISGNPEIILTNVKFDCVRSAFMNSFINEGYTLRNVSNTQIVAGKKSTNAPLWYHTFYLGAPEERVTILFIPLDIPDAFQVVSSAVYVSDPGTASEKIYPVQGVQEDQEQLMSMQSIIENRCRKKIDFGNTNQ